MAQDGLIEQTRISDIRTSKAKPENRALIAQSVGAANYDRFSF